jgi:anti-sigma factor RsiW
MDSEFAEHVSEPLAGEPEMQRVRQWILWDTDERATTQAWTGFIRLLLNWVTNGLSCMVVTAVYINLPKT